jgi:hypothetical protein
MFKKKYNFLKNETALLFYENAHSGSEAATKRWESDLYGKDFVEGCSHPDFWFDYLERMMECIKLEQKTLEEKNGIIKHISSREWAD